MGYSVSAGVAALQIATAALRAGIPYGSCLYTVPGGGAQTTLFDMEIDFTDIDTIIIQWARSGGESTPTCKLYRDSTQIYTATSNGANALIDVSSETGKGHLILKISCSHGVGQLYNFGLRAI